MPNASLVASDNATPVGTQASPLFTAPAGLTPPNAIPVGASSGNVAAAIASATLPGVAGKTTYLGGFELTGAGATAASVITGTITGLAGGTISFNVAVPAGVTVGLTPLVVEFPIPLPASAPNTAIVVSFPSLGAGNTNACVNAHGFQI